MGKLGFLLQLLGILAGMSAMLLCLLATKEKSAGGMFRWSKIFILLQTTLITAAVITLWTALFAGNFNLAFVSNVTDRDLPLMFKISAFWSGGNGSVLLWSWIASIFAAVETQRIRRHSTVYQSYVFLIPAFTASFFLFLSTFVTPIFQTLDYTPLNGRGMNPVLQHVGMLIHPPLLYLGFAGLMMPFAHAFASLCKRDFSNTWIKLSRSWLLLSWVFLTGGIVVGSWWAYAVLGWGGYWTWDPVENASLFPWLVATAFIHSAIVYENRNRLKMLNYFLAFVAFELTIFATFLTRSGLLTDSVHSYSTRSPLGGFFLLFIALSTCIYFLLILYNRKHIDNESDFQFVSKEGVFFIGTLCITALTLVLFFYTMLPVLIEIFLGTKISVKQHSYNLISIPFFVIIFMLAGLAALMPYGKPTVKLLKSFIPAVIGGLGMVILVMLLGFLDFSAVTLTFAVSFSIFAFVHVGINAVRKGGAVKILRNRRLFGGILAHIGVGFMAFGVVYSSFYKTEMELMTAQNSRFDFYGYSILLESVEHAAAANYHYDFIRLFVYRGGKFVTELTPQIREYNNSPNLFGEVAYHSALHRDLYFAFQGYDMRRDTIWLRAVHQPLVIWIWLGAFIMAFGAIYSASARL